jgi:peptide deformylase
LPVIPIRVLPDPILRNKAKRVGIIDRSIRKLVADMIDTIRAAPGRVGLAAPQIGVSLRVIIVAMPGEKPACLINPEIVRKGKEVVVDEGCLSIPGYRGEIKRYFSVTVKGLDENGKPVRLKAEELLAQAFQHEIDHLNGILFIDRLESPDKLYKTTPENVEEAS